MSIVPIDEVERTKEVLAGFLGLEASDIYRKTDWYKDERPSESWYEFEGWEYVPGEVPNKVWWDKPFCRVKVFEYCDSVMYVLQFTPGGSVVHSFSASTDDWPSNFEEKYDDRPGLDRWVEMKIDSYRDYDLLEKRVGPDTSMNNLYLNRVGFEEGLLDYIELGSAMGNPFLEVCYPSGVLFMALVGEWLDSEWQLLHVENQKMIDETGSIAKSMFDEKVFGEKGFKDPVKLMVDQEVVYNYLKTVIDREKKRSRDRIERLDRLERYIALEPKQRT
ncbi:hypothetical protein [Methanonatronarchaeum sp. AMET-Sl]|uniref:hypothetical protein n=1 Tax=Methanonatronarchaeum sp. AMET-Sl TaxID=3037654 RepID=UPI00244DAD9E|nr:hypothetical protein [Methanonatronarchaeum sp. AMET-Sl]WGI16860.1 hypothetical protein QEN48_05020 [Methanonatronarchaeum sp. AMET-Sl]